MTPRTHSVLLEAPRRMLAYVFVAVSIWYLLWRVGTFNSQAPVLSAVIYAAEVFGFATALLHIFMCWRLTERRAPVPRPGATVDVFVPTYNESVELVRRTLLAARAMDYPHRTWLLDDGRRPAMKALAKELGCDYLTRTDNAHAKAGNLNNALAHSSGELVVIFDADHAPRADFLVQTLGYFQDEAVAFVQTPQDFYNLDSYQHRKRARNAAVWTEQSLFFRVIQRGKDTWNAAFFCGSCAVVRRSALEQIGGFATGTVTEDLHTSIRLHARGLRSVYHAEPLAFGLAPESIEPFIGQRLRWGQGAMHVWRTEGILTNRGLSWPQRINYLASVLTYFDGWQKGIFYFAPVVVLLSGHLPLRCSTAEFLIHFVPYYLLTFWTFEEVGRGYGRAFFIEQYNMARFAAFAWATLALWLPKLKFKVTPKGAAARRTLRFTTAQWLVMGLNGLAIPAGIALYAHSHQLPMQGVIANIVWACTNAALAGLVLRHTAIVQRRTRGQYRFPVPLPVRMEFSGIEVHGTIDDLSTSGLRFYGELPPFISLGSHFAGSVTLPGGPLEIAGQVRSLRALQAAPHAITGFGGTLVTTAEGQKRLEQFLFGSDLQWMVNGYCDQVTTPLGWLLPGKVEGPDRSPFSDTRWNAADLLLPRGQPAHVLVSLRDEPTGEAWILSFQALPEDCSLELKSFRRTQSACEFVRLHRIAHEQGGNGDCFVYRTVLANKEVTRNLLVESCTDQREVA